MIPPLAGSETAKGFLVLEINEEMAPKKKEKKACSELPPLWQDGANDVMWDIFGGVNQEKWDLAYGQVPYVAYVTTGKYL